MIHWVFPNAGAYPLVSFSTPTWFAEAPSMTISLVNGVNPLQTTLLELGIVSGRVALLLRSAEIQPLFGRFVSNTIRYSPPPPLVVVCYRACCLGWSCVHAQVPKMDARYGCRNEQIQITWLVIMGSCFVGCLLQGMSLPLRPVVRPRFPRELAD